MLSKIDFLNAICGKPVSVTIDGIALEIRSLTVLETEQLQGKSEIDAALGMVIAGLVTPKLEKSDIEALKQASPGFIMRLTKEISKLSGIDSSDESPTVGNG